jgi:hypothetical protein
MMAGFVILAALVLMGIKSGGLNPPPLRLGSLPQAQSPGPFLSSSSVMSVPSFPSGGSTTAGSGSRVHGATPGSGGFMP